MTELEIKNNFARNIKELRISRKMNQVQFGEKIHYSSKAISKWENADVLPDVTTLKMLADFFNISLDDLICSKHPARKSHRKLNRVLITASSTMLSFFIGAIIFSVLYFCQIPGAWKAFPAAAVSAGITFVVFASIWYRRIIINIASTTLVGLIAFMVMCFMDFQFYWIILIAGIILMIASIIFFNIRFTDRK